MSGALDGLRVLELSQFLPGSSATWFLADMGAEVIRVEAPREGERPRIEQLIDHVYNRNKKSIALDLKSERGRDLLHRLVPTVDAVVEAYRPGVADRLGAGCDELSALNERLVYCSVSAYGASGPYRALPGFDPAACALAGALAVTSDTGGDPVMFGIPVADVAAGLHAAYGVVCALFARERTGVGQRVETSMLESMFSFMGMHAARFFQTGRRTRRGVLSLAVLPPLEAADGWVVAVNETPALWRGFCLAVGHPEFEGLLHAPHEQRPAVLGAIRAAVATRTRAEWLEAALEHDCVIVPLLEVDEALEDPQALHRELVLSPDGMPPQLGLPIKLSGTPASVRSPAPRLGEHTEAVLAELEAGTTAGG